MAKDDAVAELCAHLGILPDEATLYLHLALVGAAKAGEVAETLHLHRSEVYRTMERLTARGLVRVTQERPALYSAVDIGELLDAEMQQRLAAIEALRATRAELEGLAAAMRAEAQPAKSTYKVLRGRREIYHVRGLMMRGAAASVDWATTFAPALALAQEAGELALLHRRASEGVRVRALLPASPALNDAVRGSTSCPPPSCARSTRAAPCASSSWTTASCSSSS
jgi:DNA-binding MarR family transcriptional regulator